jgi:hypothetical protein
LADAKDLRQTAKNSVIESACHHGASYPMPAIQAIAKFVVSVQQSACHVFIFYKALILLG